jgi:hexosaminidase
MKNRELLSRMALLCLLAVLGMGTSRAAAVTAAQPTPPIALVPQPVHLVATGGAVVLGPHTVIVVGPGKGIQAVADMLAHRLRTATGYAVPIKPTTPRLAAAAGDILLTTAHADPSLGAEGYQLAATPTHIVIRAPQPAGLFYGTQTLRQLLPAQVESQKRVAGVAWRVPCVQIWDQPRFGVRGLMLDSSRHIQSVAFIKRTIARMAYYKLNRFHWHLTDSNGWRLEIKRYPLLTKVGAWRQENGHTYGGFFTQAEVRQIVAYAAARFITIVPEIDMPAHSEAALAAYPALGCTPGPFHVLDIGEGTANTLCPGKPETYTFVEGVLTEVMQLFPSTIIHIGGDECPKSEWVNSPPCQALMKREGLTSEDALQNYFTRQVAAFLAAHGRRLMGWNEILQGGPLPKSVIVQQWNDPASAASAARAGNDVVCSPTGYMYFDYSNETTPLQRVYAFEPMPSGLTPAQAQHILGIEACLWTEGKTTDAIADPFLWPRVTALAEDAWSPAASRNWPDFEHRLQTGVFAHLAQMGLGAVPVDGHPTPTEVMQGLLDRADLDRGVRVGGWAPSQMSETWKTVDWDVTKSIQKPGRYTVQLNYDSGADALMVQSVTLLQNDVVVAQDTHPGRTGAVNTDRIYHFAVPTVVPGATYTLRVSLHSDGGTDSRGSLWLAGPT